MYEEGTVLKSLNSAGDRTSKGKYYLVEFKGKIIDDNGVLMGPAINPYYWKVIPKTGWVERVSNGGFSFLKGDNYRYVILAGFLSISDEKGDKYTYILDTEYFKILEDHEEKKEEVDPTKLDLTGAVFTNPCSEIMLNTKENTMNNSKKTIETITYVFGTALSDYSDESALSAITSAQSKIDKLTKMELASTKVQSMINELEAAISLLVEKLDEGE